MILASFAIFPTSEGSSVSRYIKRVLRVLDDTGLHHETNAMATVIEAPDLRSLFDALVQVDDALVTLGVDRIHIDLHVDHRLDKEATIHSKLSSIGRISP
jgi:uncharacterized protein (TIGR00106 family)